MVASWLENKSNLRFEKELPALPHLGSAAGSLAVCRRLFDGSDGFAAPNGSPGVTFPSTEINGTSTDLSTPTHPIVNGALPEIDSAAKDEFTERSEVATSLRGLLARNPHCYPRFVRDLDNKEKAYPLSKLPDSSSKYCDIANLTA
uniref:Uncharacterized protein n=1 Tax=Vespula pensylvanica TaxID=30213 RepID=A0A834PB25_VESPE|nr:hypothetical protein H0235_002977 [Vespula pensylvanica]